MRIISCFAFILLLFSCSVLRRATSDNIGREKETVIAFGSCNKTNKPQRMWDAIEKQQPFAWIWLGDNIYGDTEDMALLKRKYDKQKNHPQYKEFCSQVPVYGIWDDHDYGVNDGDRTYPMKKESRELLFDFLDVPEDDPSRSREGAYQSYTLMMGEKSIKLILLDGRYFREALLEDKKTKHRYLPNENGDLLGEAQWAFLRNELQDSQADVHLFACGIQFIPTEHYYEKWSNFPKARNRFFQLLTELQPKNPVLLSGDRHIAEVSAMEIENYDHPIYEVTASGMTHTWSNRLGGEPNKYRRGDLVIDENYGLLRIKWNEIPGIYAEIRNESDDLLLQLPLKGYSF